MSEKLLSLDTKVVLASTGATAGTTTVTTSVVDAGAGPDRYDGIMWVAVMGAVTTGCVVSLQPLDNTANSTAGGSNVGNAAAHTDTAGETANTTLISDVVNMQKRYQYATLARTTQNSAVSCILAILYRGKSRPASVDASNLALAYANAAN